MNEPKNKTDEFLYSIWNFFAASLSEKTRKNYYNVIKAYIKIPGRYRPGILFGCKVEIYLILLYPYTAKSPNSSSMRSN